MERCLYATIIGRRYASVQRNAAGPRKVRVKNLVKKIGKSTLSDRSSGKSENQGRQQQVSMYSIHSRDNVGLSSDTQDVKLEEGNRMIENSTISVRLRDMVHGCCSDGSKGTVIWEEEAEL